MNKCESCYNMKCVFVTGERTDFDTSECENFRPMTNADHIRTMSDKELAEWVKLMVCKHRSCGNCPMSDWCEPGKGIAEWLKATVEVQDG